MIYTNYNPVKIRKALIEEVKRLGLSKNVFSQNRPKAYEKMNDFAVVKVSSGVRDNQAYGDATCRIELYVKCLQDGTANEVKMEAMIEKMDNIKPKIGPYHFSSDSIISMGTDDFGFSMSAIIISTIIEQIN